MLISDYARQWAKHKKRGLGYSFQMGEECEVTSAN